MREADAADSGDLLPGGFRPMSRHKERSDASEILDAIVGDDVELRALIEEERVHAQVAREIHDLRRGRGLTQKQLADRVGTTQSVIARLEDADYEGHSLRMLRRVAGALGAHVSVRLVCEGGTPGVQDTIELLRRLRALRAVARMQRSAAESGLGSITAEVIDEEIGEARKARRGSEGSVSIPGTSAP